MDRNARLPEGSHRPWLAGAVSLLSSLATRRFCATMRSYVDTLARVDHCALVRLAKSGGAQLFGADSNPVHANQGARAAVRYVDRHHRIDPLRDAAGGVAAASVIVFRQRATKVRDGPAYCDGFDAVGIVDRLSIASPDGNGAIVALELWRQVASGEFEETEVVRLREIAPLLAAACVRHIELLTHAGADSDAWRARLAIACPAMTTRELDVAASLLSGRTLREAAAALGVARSSVVTYCERAYSRLGVRNLRELRTRFARMKGDGGLAAAPNA